MEKILKEKKEKKGYNSWIRILWKEAGGELQFNDYLFQSAHEHNTWLRDNLSLENLEPEWSTENLILNRITFCYDNVNENEALQISFNMDILYS